MLPLAEIQARVRDAMVAGTADGVLPLLIGGRDPARRLAVHQRHYQASLVTALLTKFPATAWLVGSDFVTQAARTFVRAHPPAVPCIAEFGAEFPQALAAHAAAADMPYLQSFATLEWYLGHAAVAIDYPSVAIADLAAMPEDALPDVRLMMQPGLAYLSVEWPVDELIQLYLDDRAPDQFRMAPAALWLEIRGARGSFMMTRLDAGGFAFRGAIQRGETIGVAAESALDADTEFDVGQGLTALFNEGLIVAIEREAAGAAS